MSQLKEGTNEVTRSLTRSLVVVVVVDPWSIFSVQEPGVGSGWLTSEDVHSCRHTKPFGRDAETLDDRLWRDGKTSVTYSKWQNPTPSLLRVLVPLRFCDTLGTFSDDRRRRDETFTSQHVDPLLKSLENLRSDLLLVSVYIRQRSFFT